MSAKEPGASSAKGLSIPDAQKSLADFLEGTPLYTPLSVTLSESAVLKDIAPGAFSRWCPVCRSSTTWTTTGRENFHYGSPSFRCAQCESSAVEFRLRFEPEPFGQGHPAAPTRARPLVRANRWTIRKWGQWPAWSITPPREIQEALGAENLDLYKKALISMSQAYGIGALAYFRRVIENSMTAMLDLVEEAARADGDEEALRNLERARGSKRADGTPGPRVMGKPFPGACLTPTTTVITSGRALQPAS